MRETSVSGAQQSQGVQNGQRKQQSQKRNQEAQKGEAQGSARDAPRRLRDFVKSRRCPKIARRFSAGCRMPKRSESRRGGRISCRIAPFLSSLPGLFSIPAWKPSTEVPGYSQMRDFRRAGLFAESLKPQFRLTRGSRCRTERQSHVPRCGRSGEIGRNPHHPSDGADDENQREKLKAADDEAAVVHPVAAGTNDRALREFFRALAALDEVLPPTCCGAPLLSSVRSCHRDVGNGVQSFGPGNIAR